MAMMISKFNKLIHNKAIWLIFAILISVAFVMVYTGGKSASDGIKQVDPAKEMVGTLWGKDVSRLEYGQAYQGVYVMYSMMMGRPININAEVDEIISRAAWQRVATLRKARQMGLTYTPDQVRSMIQRQTLFQNQQTGGFDKNIYDMFVNQYLRQMRLSPQSFEEIMAQNVLIEKASAMAAQGALVTEDEIKKAFHLYNDKITVEYATLPRTISGTPEVTEEDANAYFDTNREEFILPPKVIVEYVAFNVADFTNQVTVTQEQVAQFYENNKQRFIKPETATNAVPEFLALEEVQDRITDGMTMGMAQQQAFNAADAMVAGLSDETTTFAQAAEQAGRKIVSNTPAFSATEPVRGIDPSASAQFAQAAFNLEKDATHYYSDPVVGRETIYVISLVKKLDEYPLPFDAAKDDAMEGAKIVASEKAYVDKAAEIHSEIGAALKAGTSFADAASKFNLDVQTTLPFNASTPLEDEFGRDIMGATIQYDAGTLVDLINTPGDYLVAFVANKELADEEATLPSMRDDIANSIRQEKTARLAQAWQESILKEADFQDLRKKDTEETASES